MTWPTCAGRAPRCEGVDFPGRCRRLWLTHPAPYFSPLWCTCGWMPPCRCPPRARPPCGWVNMLSMDAYGPQTCAPYIDGVRQRDAHMHAWGSMCACTRLLQAQMSACALVNCVRACACAFFTRGPNDCGAGNAPAGSQPGFPCMLAEGVSRLPQACARAFSRRWAEVSSRAVHQGACMYMRFGAGCPPPHSAHGHPTTPPLYIVVGVYICHAPELPLPYGLRGRSMHE